MENKEEDWKKIEEWSKVIFSDEVLIEDEQESPISVSQLIQPETTTSIVDLPFLDSFSVSTLSSSIKTPSYTQTPPVEERLIPHSHSSFSSPL